MGSNLVGVPSPDRGLLSIDKYVGLRLLKFGGQGGATGYCRQKHNHL